MEYWSMPNKEFIEEMKKKTALAAFHHVNRRLLSLYNKLDASPDTSITLINEILELESYKATIL